MRRTLRILARIAGSFVFMFVCGVLGYLGAWAAAAKVANGHEDAGTVLMILFAPPGFLIAATIGAAVGATIMQRVLSRKSSFWRALLGAVTGLLAGAFVIYCLWRFDVDMAAEWWWIAISGVSAPITAGAVIGSGWKAKPADAAEAQS